MFVLQLKSKNESISHNISYDWYKNKIQNNCTLSKFEYGVKKNFIFSLD